MWTSLFLLILSAGAFASTDFNGLIQQGRASLRAFDFDSTQIAYAQACPTDQMAALPLPKAALCEHEFGTIAEARGQGDDAGDHYLKALAAWEKLGSPYLAYRITTLTNLGGLYRRQHRLSDAERVFAEALELVKAIAARDPESYATVLSRAAGLYGDLDQPDRARRILEEAVAGLRALNPPNSSELAYAYSSL